VSVRVVRLGSKRVAGEGVRIGTVRHPPRGVAKKDWSKRDFFDVWLPNLAPSADLVRSAKDAASDRDWRVFERRYRKEMAAPDARRVLDLLAVLSHGAQLSVGCYCADESRCHRRVLRDLLEAHGAKLA